MNKDLLLGNKIIYQKMHIKERKRHLSKLQEIKKRPSPFFSFQQPSFFRQTTLPSDSQKIIEIERNNIVLFNRIASIIKQRPKMNFPKSREFVKSLDNALYSKQRKQNELKIKNEIFSKRINEQQPTIKNDIIFKERMKNERYLRLIAKYPNYKLRTQSDFSLDQINEDDQQEVFHQKTFDFDIKIWKDTAKNQYVFIVNNLIDQQQFKLTMTAQKFKEQLEQCKLNYEKMVGNLRMEKNGSMKYIQNNIRQSSPTNCK